MKALVLVNDIGISPELHDRTFVHRITVLQGRDSRPSVVLDATIERQLALEVSVIAVAEATPLGAIISTNTLDDQRVQLVPATRFSSAIAFAELTGSRRSRGGHHVVRVGRPR